ncbi:ras GTPase-activating-like protein IQGAP3 [Neolamprologus brichardi]|uniref:ras GTPase-activating-like protein IQGAP3 n=1 Tax=Neolamprologus brichardi TaxID=32507 RepID=UPI001643963E|nr:ras GTPase-activating-like protein IQGAP3 [Neolamprologus brichardi]
MADLAANGHCECRSESPVLCQNERLTAEQMDEQRIQNVAYQYLCRLEEAKRWMEACLGEELPAPTELEEALRNGVILAKLGHRFAPSTVPQKKIYDPEQLRYQAVGLQFRHTDNINHWRNAMTALGLPAIFHPETTDVYDKKNMPRAVYCIHALSLYLYRLGLAPQIHDLYGKVKFTEEEINNMKLELDKYGIQMPAFNKIGGILANELSVDEAAVHAAVVAINEAVDQGDVGVTAVALRNPAALLTDLQEALMSVYQEMLQQARRRKAERAAGRAVAEDKDMYEEYLTQREIQDHIDAVNVRAAVEQVDEALDVADELALLSALQLPCLALRGLRTDNGPWYLDQLTADRQQKAQNQGSVDPLEHEELQEGVTAANQEARSTRNTGTSCCLLQGELQEEELFVAVEMLSAVVLINQGLEAGHLQQFSSSLVSSSAGLSDVEPALLDRYFETLAGVKQQVGRDLLTWNQLQEGIAAVNGSAQDEQQQLLAVGLINKAVMSGDPRRLISALLLPSCGVDEVSPANACKYLTLLSQARQIKAQVSRDPGAELWLADIQEAVRTANQQSQRALKLCLSVAAVNQAVKENRAKQTLRVLSLPEAELHGVLPDCAADYQRELSALMARRTRTGDNRSQWVRVRLQDGSVYFFHLSRLQGGWERPPGFVHNSVFLDRHDIQEVVGSVSAQYSRGVLWRNSEALVVRLQALCRGFLIRWRMAFVVRESVKTETNTASGKNIYSDSILECSSLPYEVSPEDALAQPEVQRRIDISIINLKNLTDRVLKAITASLHKLPYGLRYTAKVLRDALKAKFPEAGEDELYKIVGNLVYYRYMNPAVVAPDGFDVVDRSAGSALQPGQRHILGSIARVLQHAAANKHFHGGGYHITALNQYISQTHSRFRRFLQSVCDVPEPEDRFSMDEYSELLIVNRPVIYISVSELLNTHKLLLEHQEVLCPDPSDPLGLILKDLGPVPGLQELTGESAADPGSDAQSSKMEVSLTLTNKFDIFDDANDKPDARGLLLSTKQLIIDVIRTQSGDSLRDILRTTPSRDQEKKRKILRSLRHLEGLGTLKSPDSENQILQMIAKDIRQQRLHRQRRGAELLKLHQTLSSLQAKSSFHSEQVDYYRHYITSCLDNLTASKSTNQKAADGKGRNKLPALSYSATRLHEKGVLLEIEDLPVTQFKNVMFEIAAGPERGSFKVKARFLGVEMEEFLLKYQDLLQLQYEGVAVMKMFSKAKVNVNLLIFLLNKKFFKK